MMNLKERIFWLLMAGCLISFLITFPGCKPLEKIEYKTVYDTCYLTKEVKDSIFVKDSVYIYSKADTVYYIKWKEKVKYLVKTDTIFKASTDTLYIDKVEYKEVEKKRPTRDIFAVFGLVSLLSLVGFIFYKIKRFK